MRHTIIPKRMKFEPRNSPTTKIDGTTILPLGSWAGAHFVLLSPAQVSNGVHKWSVPVKTNAFQGFKTHLLPELLVALSYSVIRYIYHIYFCLFSSNLYPRVVLTIPHTSVLFGGPVGKTALRHKFSQMDEAAERASALATSLDYSVREMDLGGEVSHCNGCGIRFF